MVYTQLQRHCLQPLIYIMQLYTQNHTELGKGKTSRSATHSGGCGRDGKREEVWGRGGRRTGTIMFVIISPSFVKTSQCYLHTSEVNDMKGCGEKKKKNERRKHTVHEARTPSETVQWLGEVNERGSEGSNPTRPSGPVGHPHCDPFHDKADENFQHCFA